jgi:YVTN family beta-propeller protein
MASAPLAPVMRRGSPFLHLREGKRAKLGAVLLCSFLAGALGCRDRDFPNYPANYREYAYVSNGGSDTVTVLDIVNMRQERVIAVGKSPSGLGVNPHRNEVYAVNSGSDTVSVIDAQANRVAANIRVQQKPLFIDVDENGEKAYVTNSRSNNVSVLDLSQRREIGVIGVGEGPRVARIANDGKTLVVTNHDSGSVSIADVASLKVRSSFDHCPGATDSIILADSSKAFVSCANGHQIMVIALAHANGSNPLPTDTLLTFLDVGKSPVDLALKPDGGEAFVSNFDSDTISELTTSSNEVGGAYLMGTHPIRSLVSSDNSLLYVSNFGSGRVSIYSIDDGKLLRPGVKVGEGPDALAFASSGHFLLVVDSQSGDIAVIRTANPASLLTLFPAGRSPNDVVVKNFLVR